MMRHVTVFGLAVLLVSLVAPATAAESDAISTQWPLATAGLHEDFPALCLDQAGVPWVAYVEHDGTTDRLKLARKTEDGLQVQGELAGPGIIHQPVIACDGQGAVWVIWSELGRDGRWALMARAVRDGKVAAENKTLEATSGSAVFADAGTDRAGRVWVTWQSFRGGPSDVFAMHYDPQKAEWSDEIRVTSNAAGDWEPRLAFGRDGAAIAFDSSLGGCFNVYLARVKASGKVSVRRVSEAARYQGRASIAASPDGDSYWLAWENGRERWGKDSRGVDGKTGLNWGKRIEVARVDAADGTVSILPDPTPILKLAVPIDHPGVKPGEAPVPAVNLPEVVIDGGGNPWLVSRFYRANRWKLAVMKYGVGEQSWTRAVTLLPSAYGQDRRCSSTRDKDGHLWLAWPTDRRTNKKMLTSELQLARIDSGFKLPAGEAPAAKPKAAKKAVARWGADTPERPRSDRHQWEVGGKNYSLYWGDFHRHTDVSNCRTPDDGCIVEQFRYACDIGKLDYLGTSDHTDIGKMYDPYEWWCNQKLADVFHAPGFVNSFYVYEREQSWPWGHRNVIFGQRGGPVVYIKRALYRNSPWQKTFPVGEGGKEIHPKELWEVLKTTGMDVAVISHTGATGMGTNWDGYDHIDHEVENLVEIYQGARVSYEGLHTPQPTVGFPKGKKLKADDHGSVKTGKDFGKHNKGVYHNALHNGHELGVFASSDHISTHTSFGGVYTEEFSRKGIIEGLNARRTIAATDKIFVHFTCNGQLLGSVFETREDPVLDLAVKGTAGLRAVTVVRNEEDYHSFKPEGNELAATYTDPDPLDGENRYYIRVEQVDGNMAWASPVWVTVKKGE